MEKRYYIKPNFKKCNINISATLAEFLGAPNKNEILPKLKEELKKDYKNVVFICFDGLGIHPIKKNLDENDFLRRNIKQILVSTFPSTTTNATTSLMLNKLPLEHGWFGWSMNFKKLNKNVDIFTNCDSLTSEKICISDSPLSDLDYYFDNTNSEYSINTVFSSYVKVKYEDRNNIFTNSREFFECIENICSKEEKQFIYAYYPQPDSIMHDYGVSSNETKKVIESISKNVERLYNEVKDTLFIVTADHGQVDIEGYVNLYEDERLMEMLEIYPFMEVRAPSFIVKENQKEEFKEYFSQKYGDDFILYESSELINRGYFGDFGDKGHLLGDFIAIGTYSHKQAILIPNGVRFKGHHTSLTEEMEVPLIIIGKK